MAKPYIRTNWRDHIVDTQTGDTIQDGTRFTAGRMNNIENGIYNAYEELEAYERQLDRMSAELEMVGRSPINNGVFYDPLDGGDGKDMTMLSVSAVVQSGTTAGATTITVDTVPFSANDTITIYDEENSETASVQSVSGNDVTVSALTNAYKKGSYVVRSNAVVNADMEELTFGTWGTYTINAEEVI